MTQSKTTRCGQRDGITLFEVVVALAIFLFSVAVLAEISSVGSEYALNAKRKSQGTLLCESVMAEAVAGIAPLTGSDYTEFEEDDAEAGTENKQRWQWKLEALPGPVEGLFEVKAFVRTQIGQETYYEVSMTRLVMNPMFRGSVADVPADPAEAVEEPLPEDPETEEEE